MRRGNGEQFWNLMAGSVYELIGLAVLIVVAVWLTLRVRAWFRDHEDPAEQDHVMLSEIGELHREGGLTDEEYRSIRGRLVQRLDQPPRGTDSGD